MSYLNDPRVLFAAERTLMAWNRTAVGLITLGFVVERFGLFIKMMHVNAVSGQREFSFWLGLTIIGFAVLINILSVLQFWRVRRQLTASEIPTGYLSWAAASLNLVIAMLGGVLIYYLQREYG